MSRFSQEIEENLILLLKEWMKHHGRSQSDLKSSLNASSSRMPALIQELQKDFSKGGISKIASRLCDIETIWKAEGTKTNSSEIIPSQNDDRLDSNKDPFDQLDLLMEEIREVCED